MKNGVLRALRFFLHNTFNMYKSMVLAILIYIIISIGTADGGYFITFIVPFLLAMPMFEGIGAFSGAYKYTVGLSLSRKSFFLGGLISKLIYAVPATIIAFCVALYVPTVPLQTPQALLCFALGTIFFSLFGDFEGFIIVKCEKHGFLIYTITTLLVIFGFVVITVVMLINNDKFFELLLSDWRTAVALVGGIMALTVVNRLTSKTLEVRA